MNEEPVIQTLTALVSVPGFGRSTIRKLLKFWQKKEVDIVESWNRKKRWKAESEVLTEAQQEAWKDFKKKWTVEGYWQSVRSEGIEVLSQDHLPQLLQHIADPPLLLFCQGNLQCLSPRHVSVVGSRTPTRYGQWATQHIVAGLVEQDISIVSGFMVGIDFQSHRTAMDCGGRSVGVLGFGFGTMYPRHLTHVAQEFLSLGNLFVSEYPPGLPPNKGQFPERNRIVAGISEATVVIEAKENSGSLITAQCAVDSGRAVGAVPGPIDSVYSRGTHLLLRQGAFLVENSNNVLEEIGFFSQKSRQNTV